jgi:subtilisin family serine protease
MIVGLACLGPAHHVCGQLEHVPGEILIRPAARENAHLAAAVTAVGLTVLETDAFSGVMRVAVPEGAEAAWIRSFAARADVVYAERNGLGRGGLIPDDTYFTVQWHLRNTGQSGGTSGADIDAVPAWDISTGSPSVVIAVLDSGIDSDHPEFAGRIDPDGWDYVNEDSNPEDDHGHGSWVSGSLGANGDNGFAVAGVDWRCMILPIKVLNANNGGTTFDLAQGLYYSAAQADVQVISMSLINYPGNSTLIDALQAARDAGKILIACAGNGGMGDADVSFPGASPLTISIGATTHFDDRAGFSGTGAALDFVAPGANIVTVRYGSHADNFSTVSGCSFATPITAGVTGLLLDRAATLGLDLDQDGVYDLLLAGAEDQVGDPAEDTPGRDDFFGHGRINAHHALLALCTVLEYQKFLSDDVAAGDEFGTAVAISGATAVIGAPSDDDNGDRSGSARVFRFEGPTWVEEQSLLADDGAAGDELGRAVAVSGEIAAIGAPSDDDNGDDSGAAYVFRFDGSSWVQESKLLPDDNAAGDELGHAVAVSGDAVVIGAISDDDNGDRSGSAYVFRFDGSTWIEEDKLVPDDGATGDEFGVSVGIDGDVILIGARKDDDNGSDSGSVYVFRFDGSNWVPEEKLVAGDGEAGDFFGFSVGVSGSTALIGAYGDDDNGSAAGSAYVFGFDGANWAEEQKLLPADGDGGDTFGRAVALSDELAVMGAYRDEDNGSVAGAAYVFGLDGSDWIEQRKLLPADGAAGDSFGYAVAASGTTAVIGAFKDDDHGLTSGSAYVYPEDPPFDCNGNDVTDDCDIANGTSDDANGNGVPDECECPWDVDGSGGVGIGDLLALLAAWGTDPGGPPDFNGDGTVGIADLLELLANWGPCA